MYNLPQNTSNVNQTFTKWNNNILEALAMYRIPGEANQILRVIIRKTWGYQKIEDKISNSQFVKATDMVKNNVYRAIDILIKMNIVIKKDNKRLSKKITNVIKKDNKNNNNQKRLQNNSTYCIQMDFTQWKPLTKIKRGVIKKDNKRLSKKITSVIKKDNKRLSKKRPTIYNKEKKKRKIPKPPTFFILKNKKTFKENIIQNEENNILPSQRKMIKEICELYKSKPIFKEYTQKHLTKFILPKLQSGHSIEILKNILIKMGKKHVDKKTDYLLKPQLLFDKFFEDNFNELKKGDDKTIEDYFKKQEEKYKKN